MVTLEFIHVPNGDVREEGPFEFVQITYDTVRVGPEGDRFIATFQDGAWRHEDGSTWTDFSVYAA